MEFEENMAMILDTTPSPSIKGDTAPPPQPSLGFDLSVLRDAAAPDRESP